MPGTVSGSGTSPQQYKCMAGAPFSHTSPLKGVNRTMGNMNEGSGDQLSLSDTTAQLPPAGGRVAVKTLDDPQVQKGNLNVLLSLRTLFSQGCRPHNPNCLQKYFIFYMIFTLMISRF